MWQILKVAHDDAHVERGGKWFIAHFGGRLVIS